MAAQESYLKIKREEYNKALDTVESYNNQLFTGIVGNSGKCSRCEIDDAKSKHTCPSLEEINDDSETLCDCCSDCEHECCMDI
jgi:hypothetical protein